MFDIYLFDMMPDDIKSRLQHMKYDTNQTILFAENENDYVYFLHKGKAEAYVPTQQGYYAQIHIYEAGSFFGELEQFYEGRKPVEISAITPCIVDRLHKNDFFDWMKKDFEATKFIIKEIAYKLILNVEHIEQISVLSVKERLLHCIANHYHRGDLDTLTKSQIAKETRAPTRSINRAIVECNSQGILCYQNKRFKILDEKKLNDCL